MDTLLFPSFACSFSKVAALSSLEENLFLSLPFCEKQLLAGREQDLTVSDTGLKEKFLHKNKGINLLQVPEIDRTMLNKSDIAQTL